MNEQEERLRHAQRVFGGVEGSGKFRQDVLVAALGTLRVLLEAELSVAEIAFVGKLLADPSQWHVILQAKDDTKE